MLVIKWNDQYAKEFWKYDGYVEMKVTPNKLEAKLFPIEEREIVENIARGIGGKVEDAWEVKTWN